MSCIRLWINSHLKTLECAFLTVTNYRYLKFSTINDLNLSKCHEHLPLTKLKTSNLDFLYFQNIKISNYLPFMNIQFFNTSIITYVYLKFPFYISLCFLIIQSITHSFNFASFWISNSIKVNVLVLGHVPESGQSQSFPTFVKWIINKFYWNFFFK